MASSTTFILLAIALVAASALAAPLDEPAGQEPKPATTTVASSSTQASETSTPASSASTLSPGTSTSTFTNTSFTCYGKSLGYYADISQKCKVYHFCLLGEYNGEPIYQRVSYLCMNDKLFDQQALDCVKESEMKAPCESSDKHYDVSNSMLRKAVLGSQASNETEAAKTEEEHKSSTTTSTTTTTTQAP